MTEVITVRFREGGKEYSFDPQGMRIETGEDVILDTVQGYTYGECARGNHMITDDMVQEPLRTVVRIATEEDTRQEEENRHRAKKALELCRSKVQDLDLEMEPISAEYNFEGTKVLILFTSEKRVDFRSLVRELASGLHSRIELRQIGVRDEARIMGGLGTCGKPFCCTQFLTDFQMVSIKMAKTQGLSLNPTKISGACGRLMCCLKFEQDAYQDAVRRCPKQYSFVETPDGVGNVTDVDLLREEVKVSLDGSEDKPRTYSVDEINVIASGKSKRPDDYVVPLPEQLAALRKKKEPEEEPVQGERPILYQAAEDAESSHPKDKKTSSAGRKSSSGREKQRTRQRSGTGERDAGKTEQDEKYEEMAGSVPPARKPKNNSRRRRHRPKNTQRGE